MTFTLRKQSLGHQILQRVMLLSVIAILSSFIAVLLALVVALQTVVLQLKESTSTVALTFENFLGDVKSDLLATSSTLNLNQDTQFVLRRLLERHAAIFEVFLIQPNGNIIAHRRRVGLEKQSQLAKQPWLSQTQNGLIYISVINSEELGIPFIDIAVPVVNEENQLVASLVAKIDLSALWNKVIEFRIGETGYVYITDQSGQLLSYRDLRLLQLNVTMQQLTSYTPQQIVASNLIIYQGINQSLVMASGIKLESSPWIIIVEQPLQDLISPLLFQGIIFSSTLLVIIILAYNIIAFIQQAVVAPLLTLQHGVNLISQGDLEQHINITVENELGLLASAFNHMARRLQTLINTLEEQVLARTAELHAANQQLAHLNADKDKFFSIIAHDLKGPFTPVLGNAKTLVEQANHLPRPEIKTLGDIMLRSAQNTFGLLENLLHWARLQMGRMEFQPKPLNLREVLQQTVNLLQGTAENKGISLTSLLQAEVMVQADENMLATIVRNLTNNALKFTPRGGQVRLSAKGLGMRNQELVSPNAEILKPDYVEIQVIDTGVGISPENLAKLFQVGQHVSTTGTAEEKGTGLGLIMCQEMVHKHGGRMGVESEEGRGSRFWFSLPAVEPLPEGDWLAEVGVELVTPLEIQRYTVPSRERLMELQALALGGDTLNIKVWLQAEGEAYPEFCEQVLQLVEMFDWAGVVEMVEGYLEMKN